MLEGEKLILDTYEALFGPKAKDPESTLLIVTYDEAGGCFDHVPPPLHKESTSQFPSPHTSYRWDRLGIRVPCLFVSPWILEKTILRRETNSQQGKKKCCSTPRKTSKVILYLFSLSIRSYISFQEC